MNNTHHMSLEEFDHMVYLACHRMPDGTTDEYGHPGSGCVSSGWVYPVGVFPGRWETGFNYIIFNRPY